MRACLRRLLASLCLLVPIAAPCAPGELDPSFGAGGVLYTDFGGWVGSVEIVASVRQSTGKFIVVGHTFSSDRGRRIAVTRLNADGTFDWTYGTFGWTIFGSNVWEELRPVSAAVAADDSIAIVGRRTEERSGSSAFVTRLSPTGAYDPAAGWGVLPIDSLSVSEYPQAIAIDQASGNLVVTGYLDATPRNSYVTVYNGAGTRLSSVALPMAATGGRANSANAILADPAGGAFYLAGYIEDTLANRDFMAVKIRSDLQLDPAFGTNGIATLDFGATDEAFGLAIQNTRGALVVGRSAAGEAGRLALARFSLSTGTFDATFGVEGKVLTAVPWNGNATSYATAASVVVSWPAPIYTGDVFFVLGTARPDLGSATSTQKVVVARYDASGATVGAFGGNGVGILESGPGAGSESPVGGAELGSDLLLVANNLAGDTNRLVLVSRNISFGGGSSTSMLAYVPTDDFVEHMVRTSDGRLVSGVIVDGFDRYLVSRLPDGSQDPAFGSGGSRPLSQFFASGEYRLAADSSGRILTVGVIPVSPPTLLVQRFTRTGEQDPTFTFALIERPGVSFVTPNDIIVRPDGKIVVLSTAPAPLSPQRNRMTVTFIEPDGLGAVREVPLDRGTASHEGRSLAVQGDAVIVSGMDGNGSLIFRVTAEGSDDLSFADGAPGARVSCTPQHDVGRSLAVGPGGVIYVAGGLGDKACFARLLPNGAPDPAFGSDGIVTLALSPGNVNQARGLAIQPDGRLLAGVTTDGDGVAVVRLRDDGSLDPSFNGSGRAFLSDNDIVMGLALQPDGKAVVWGSSDRFAHWDAMLARFEAGGAVDTTPEGFTFVDVTGVPVSTLVVSNAVTITGIDAPAPLSVSGGEYSIGCNGTFTAAASSISGGQSVCVRHVSAATPNAPTHTALTVGGVSDTFTSTTALVVDTFLTATPPNPNGPNGNSFSFTSSNVAATIRFECALDAQSWTNCSSPMTVFPGNGSHTFQVRAVSASGPDPTPASYTWTVDLIAPDTAIISAPLELTTSDVATFTFTSNDPTARFECSLDNDLFRACTSPKTYTTLIQGGHLFQVRAVDAVGNADFFPAKVIWTLDSEPPNTTITSQPPLNSPSSSATFAFTTNDPTATLQCSIDNQPLALCASPITYTGLSEGNHRFVLRAVDRAGNIDPSPSVWFWTVDTIAPDTTITSGPAAVSASTSATFGVTFTVFAALQCSLDGAPFAACTAPVTYTGLAQGSHTFAARAIDSAGNVDPTPATATWVVDTAAPQTTIGSGPSALTSSQTPTFTFSSNESAATFQCRLDGGAFLACSSPSSYMDLAAGPHTFDVRAVDAAGNVDATPARHTWTIDFDDPETLISSGPALRSSSTAASFTFTADEANATFECSLDAAPFAACASPVSYASLAEGAHVFQVRAVDPALNVDDSPSVFDWVVDTVAPDTTITSGPPSGSIASNSVGFKMSSTESPELFECRLDAGAWGACTSPVAYASLAEGSHTFEVRAKDAAGNLDASPAAHTWTVDTLPPDTSVVFNPIGSPTNSTSFTATMLVMLGGGGYDCRLDGAPFAPCTSPHTVSGLANGSHTIEVRARDAAGNVDPTPATHTWIVDTLPPETTIVNGPSGTTASNSAVFTLSSGEPAPAFFECRLDGGSWTPCAAGTYTGLAEGSHTFEARAKDAAGNFDPTPALRTWTVDTVAPDTTILSGPSGTVASNVASFSMASTESPALFECRLDAGAWTACSSGVTYSGLGDGTHTFETRAKDAAGNLDASPATRAWIVDTTAPQTSLDSGPSGAVASTSAAFAFSANEPASFQCRLDGAAFAACASGIGYSGLAQGSHVFEVRATDGVGNTDATPASRAWIVDTLAPDTTIASGPSGNNNPDTATFTFTSTEPGGSFECKLDAAPFVACASATTYTALVRGEHTFQVRAVDAAGNIDPTPAVRVWRSK